MKKNLLSLFLLLFYAVSLNATAVDKVLNIYASGLDVHQTDGVTTIDYVLNTQANSLVVKLYDGESLIKEISIPAGAGDANYAKGAHAGVALDLTGVEAGTYTWALLASADAHITPVEDKYEPEYTTSFTSVTNATARGMAFDGDTESPYFGTIYIAKNYAGGIISLSPLFVSSQIVSGVSSWSNKPASPMRIAIGDDGLLYVTDYSDVTPNITIIDRSNNNSYSSVFEADHYDSGTGIARTSGGDAINGSISGCCVVGIGEKRKLYTIDEDVRSNSKLNILEYNIKNLSSLWTSGYTRVAFANEGDNNKLVNSNASLYADGHEGFWLAQNVETTSASIPAFFHVNSSGTVDWVCPSTATPTTDATDKKTYGSLFVSHDKSLVVNTCGKRAMFWEPTFSGNTLSGVELLQTAKTDVNVNYNVVVDPAHNIYLFGSGRMYVYSPSTSDNSYETKARSSKTITVSYSRSSLTVDNLSTICLPYAVDAAALWGAEVYEVASATSNAGVLQYITLGEVTDDLVAGKPYFIKPMSTIFSCVYNGDEEDEVQAANGLVGKLANTDETVPADGTCYILKGGLLHKVPEGVTVSFVRNRAYFDLDEYVGPTSAPGQRMLTVPCAPETTTDMEKVENDENVTKYFRDGQLYIRREGVTYDALGRVVR